MATRFVSHRAFSSCRVVNILTRSIVLWQTPSARGLAWISRLPSAETRPEERVLAARNEHPTKKILNKPSFLVYQSTLPFTQAVPARTPQGYKAHSPAPGATRNCAVSRLPPRGRPNHNSFSWTPASCALENGWPLPKIPSFRKSM